MPRGKSFDEIVADARTLIRVWSENPRFSMGEVTFESFQAELATFMATLAHTEDLRTQLTKAVSDGNDQAGDIIDKCVRARAAALGQFGLNSTQYEQLGGTRKSERKSAKKKSSGDSGTPKT